MAVSKYYTINESNDIGNVNIHTQVFEVIAMSACEEVEGVSKTFESLTQTIADTFNTKKHRHGVVVDFTNNELVIDIYVSIKSGYTINEVAENIQRNIHQMIYHMTSVKTSEILVHVVSIDFE